MVDDSALPEQAQWVEEIRAPTAQLPVVEESRWNTTKTGPSRKSARIDQIIMMVEKLLETTCKWKEEHDYEADSRKMKELTKRLNEPRRH